MLDLCELNIIIEALKGYASILTTEITLTNSYEQCARINDFIGLYNKLEREACRLEGLF